MKKHSGYLILALLCVSAAQADVVHPIRDQTVLTDHRDPRVREACRAHLELEEKKLPLLPGAESPGCTTIQEIFAKAVNEGARACVYSYDLNVRAFFSNAMDEALKGQDYYCTPAQAMLAPCEQCGKSLANVKKVTETFSTAEIKQSLGTYSGLFKTLYLGAANSPCPELAAHKDEVQAKIMQLASELNRAKVTEVRYTRAKVEYKESTHQVTLMKPETSHFHEDLPAIEVGSAGFSDGSRTPAAESRVGETRVAEANAQVSNGSATSSNGNGSGSNTNVSTTGTQARTPALEPRFPENVNLNRFLASGPTGSSGPRAGGSNNVGGDIASTAAIANTTASTANRSSRPALPQGLDISGRLSDGRIGFAYTDPKDPSKNYVGYQIRDPKTNKLKTYAYVTSRENAEAVKKNPTLCDPFIKDAQAHAPRANSDASALGRGNELLGPKNSKKPDTDLAQVAPTETQAQAQTQDPSQAQSGAGTSTDSGNSDSQFHIASGMPNGTGLKPNARTGLDPDAKVGLKTGDAQASASAATSDETPRSSLEVQAAAQNTAQQNLSIASPTGSSTGLKDHPNVGLDSGPSGTGIKSQIKPSPDSAQSDSTQDGTLRIGKPAASTSSANSETTASSSKPATSQRKPKPAKKPHPKTASTTPKSQSKATEAQKQKVSEYRSVAITSKGFGTVRYFLLNKFPNPEIGRWEIVDGKTEEIRYNMPADNNVIKDLTAHPEKLESTFKSTKAKFQDVKPHFLDPMVSDALNQLLLK